MLVYMSKELLNLVLKARHPSGSAFCTGILYRCTWLGIGMAPPRLGLVLEDKAFLNFHVHATKTLKSSNKGNLLFFSGCSGTWLKRCRCMLKSLSTEGKWVVSVWVMPLWLCWWATINFIGLQLGVVHQNSNHHRRSQVLPGYGQLGWPAQGPSDQGWCLTGPQQAHICLHTVPPPSPQLSHR